jgi:hypothetical protein
MKNSYMKLGVYAACTIVIFIDCSAYLTFSIFLGYRVHAEEQLQGAVPACF